MIESEPMFTVGETIKCINRENPSRVVIGAVMRYDHLSVSIVRQKQKHWGSTDYTYYNWKIEKAAQ